MENNSDCPYCGTSILIDDAMLCPGCRSKIYYGRKPDISSFTGFTMAYYKTKSKANSDTQRTTEGIVFKKIIKDKIEVRIGAALDQLVAAKELLHELNKKMENRKAVLEAEDDRFKVAEEIHKKNQENETYAEFQRAIMNRCSVAEENYNLNIKDREEERQIKEKIASLLEELNVKDGNHSMISFVFIGICAIILIFQLVKHVVR